MTTLVPLGLKEVAIPMPGEKALTATQLKNLEKIVDGDFTDLRNRILTQINSEASKRSDEIAVKYADTTKVDQAREQILKLLSETDVKLAKAVETLKTKGIVFSGGGFRPLASYSIPVNPAQSGESIEQGKLNSAKSRITAQVNNTIAAMQRVLQRKILLSAITSTVAADIVNSIPDPETILNKIEEDLSDSEDDLKIIGLK